MRVQPAERMLGNMRTLTDRLEEAYLRVKARALPRYMALRFRPGNQRYGIPPNGIETTLRKIRSGKAPIALVDTGRLASAISTRPWTVIGRTRLTTRLPSYFVHLNDKYGILSLTRQERAQLLLAAKDEAHRTP